MLQLRGNFLWIMLVLYIIVIVFAVTSFADAVPSNNFWRNNDPIQIQLTDGNFVCKNSSNDKSDQYNCDYCGVSRENLQNETNEINVAAFQNGSPGEALTVTLPVMSNRSGLVYFQLCEITDVDICIFKKRVYIIESADYSYNYSYNDSTNKLTLQVPENIPIGQYALRWNFKIEYGHLISCAYIKISEKYSTGQPTSFQETNTSIHDIGSGFSKKTHPAVEKISHEHTPRTKRPISGVPTFRKSDTDFRDKEFSIADSDFTHENNSDATQNKADMFEYNVVSNMTDQTPIDDAIDTPPNITNSVYDFVQNNNRTLSVEQLTSKSNEVMVNNNNSSESKQRERLSNSLNVSDYSLSDNDSEHVLGKLLSVMLDYLTDTPLDNLDNTILVNGGKSLIEQYPTESQKPLLANKPNTGFSYIEPLLLTGEISILDGTDNGKHERANSDKRTITTTVTTEGLDRKEAAINSRDDDTYYYPKNDLSINITNDGGISNGSNLSFSTVSVHSIDSKQINVLRNDTLNISLSNATKEPFLATDGNFTINAINAHASLPDVETSTANIITQSMNSKYLNKLNDDRHTTNETNLNKTDTYYLEQKERTSINMTGFNSLENAIKLNQTHSDSRAEENSTSAINVWVDNEYITHEQGLSDLNGTSENNTENTVSKVQEQEYQRSLRLDNSTGKDFMEIHIVSPDNSTTGNYSNSFSKNGNQNDTDQEELSSINLYGIYIPPTTNIAVNSIQEKQQISDTKRNTFQNYIKAQDTQIKELSSTKSGNRKEDSFTIGSKDLMELILNPSNHYQKVTNKVQSKYTVSKQKNILAQSTIKHQFPMKRPQLSWLSGKTPSVNRLVDYGTMPSYVALPANFGFMTNTKSTDNMSKYMLNRPTLAFAKNSGNIKRTRISKKKRKRKRKQNKSKKASKSKSSKKSKKSKDSSIKSKQIATNIYHEKISKYISDVKHMLSTVNTKGPSNKVSNMTLEPRLSKLVLPANIYGINIQSVINKELANEPVYKTIPEASVTPKVTTKTSRSRLHPNYIIAGTVNISDLGNHPFNVRNGKTPTNNFAETVISDLIDGSIIEKDHASTVAEKHVKNKNSEQKKKDPISKIVSSNNKETSTSRKGYFLKSSVDAKVVENSSHSEATKSATMSSVKNKHLDNNVKSKSKVSSADSKVIADLIKMGFIDKDSLPLIDLTNLKSTYITEAEKNSNINTKTGQSGPATVEKIEGGTGEKAEHINGEFQRSTIFPTTSAIKVILKDEHFFSSKAPTPTSKIEILKPIISDKSHLASKDKIIRKSSSKIENKQISISNKVTSNTVKFPKQRQNEKITKHEKNVKLIQADKLQNNRNNKAKTKNKNDKRNILHEGIPNTKANDSLRKHVPTIEIAQTSSMNKIDNSGSKQSKETSSKVSKSKVSAITQVPNQIKTSGDPGKTLSSVDKLKNNAENKKVKIPHEKDQTNANSKTEILVNNVVKKGDRKTISPPSKALDIGDGNKKTTLDKAITNDEVDKKVPSDKVIQNVDVDKKVPSGKAMTHMDIDKKVSSGKAMTNMDIEKNVSSGKEMTIVDVDKKVSSGKAMTIVDVDKKIPSGKAMANVDDDKKASGKEMTIVDVDKKASSSKTMTIVDDDKKVPSGKAMTNDDVDKKVPSGKAMTNVDDDKKVPSGKAMPNVDDDKKVPSGKVMTTVDVDKKVPSGKAMTNVDDDKKVPSGKAMTNVDVEKKVPSDKTMTNVDVDKKVPSDKTMTNVDVDKKVPSDKAMNNVDVDNKVPSGKAKTNLDVDKKVTSGKAMTNMDIDKKVSSGKEMTIVDDDKKVPSDKPMTNVDVDKKVPSDKAMNNVDVDNKVPSGKAKTNLDVDKKVPSGKAMTNMDIDKKVSSGKEMTIVDVDKKVSSGKAMTIVHVDKKIPSGKALKNVDDDKKVASSKGMTIVDVDKKVSAGKIMTIVDVDKKVPAGKAMTNVDDDMKVPSGKALTNVDDDMKVPAGKAMTNVDDDMKVPSGKAMTNVDNDKKVPSGKAMTNVDDDKKVPPGKPITNVDVDTKVPSDKTITNVDVEKKVPSDKAMNNIDVDKKVPSGKAMTNMDIDKKVSSGKKMTIVDVDKKVSSGKAMTIVDVDKKIPSGKAMTNVDDDKKVSAGKTITIVDVDKKVPLGKAMTNVDDDMKVPSGKAMTNVDVDKKVPSGKAMTHVDVDKKVYSGKAMTNVDVDKKVPSDKAMNNVHIHKKVPSDKAMNNVDVDKKFPSDKAMTNVDIDKKFPSDKAMTNVDVDKKFPSGKARTNVDAFTNVDGDKKVLSEDNDDETSLGNVKRNKGSVIKSPLVKITESDRNDKNTLNKSDIKAERGKLKSTDKEMTNDNKLSPQSIKIDPNKKVNNNNRKLSQNSDIKTGNKNKVTYRQTNHRNRDNETRLTTDKLKTDKDNSMRASTNMEMINTDKGRSRTLRKVNEKVAENKHLSPSAISRMKSRYDSNLTSDTKEKHLKKSTSVNVSKTSNKHSDNTPSDRVSNNGKNVTTAAEIANKENRITSSTNTKKSMSGKIEKPLIPKREIKNENYHETSRAKTPNATKSNSGKVTLDDDDYKILLSEKARKHGNLTSSNISERQTQDISDDLLEKNGDHAKKSNTDISMPFVTKEKKLRSNKTTKTTADDIQFLVNTSSENTIDGTVTSIKSKINKKSTNNSGKDMNNNPTYSTIRKPVTSYMKTIVSEIDKNENQVISSIILKTIDEMSENQYSSVKYLGNITNINSIQLDTNGVSKDNLTTIEKRKQVSKMINKTALNRTDSALPDAQKIRQNLKYNMFTSHNSSDIKSNFKDRTAEKDNDKSPLEVVQNTSFVRRKLIKSPTPDQVSLVKIKGKLKSNKKTVKKTDGKPSKINDGIFNARGTQSSVKYTQNKTNNIGREKTIQSSVESIAKTIRTLPKAGKDLSDVSTNIYKHVISKNTRSDITNVTLNGMKDINRKSSDKLSTTSISKSTYIQNERKQNKITTNKKDVKHNNMERSGASIVSKVNMSGVSHSKYKIQGAKNTVYSDSGDLKSFDIDRSGAAIVSKVNMSGVSHSKYKIHGAQKTNPDTRHFQSTNTLFNETPDLSNKRKDKSLNKSNSYLTDKTLTEKKLNTRVNYGAPKYEILPETHTKKENIADTPGISYTQSKTGDSTMKKEDGRDMPGHARKGSLNELSKNQGRKMMSVTSTTSDNKHNDTSKHTQMFDKSANNVATESRSAHIIKGTTAKNTSKQKMTTHSYGYSPSHEFYLQSNGGQRYTQTSLLSRHKAPIINPDDLREILKRMNNTHKPKEILTTSRHANTKLNSKKISSVSYTAVIKSRHGKDGTNEILKDKNAKGHSTLTKTEESTYSKLKNQSKSSNLGQPSEISSEKIVKKETSPDNADTTAEPWPSLASGTMEEDSKTPGMVINGQDAAIITGQYWPALVSQNLHWTDTAPHSMSLSIGHSTDGTYISDPLTSLNAHGDFNNYNPHSLGLTQSGYPGEIERKLDKVDSKLHRQTSMHYTEGNKNDNISLINSSSINERKQSTPRQNIQKSNSGQNIQQSGLRHNSQQPNSNYSNRQLNDTAYHENSLIPTVRNKHVPSDLTKIQSTNGKATSTIPRNVFRFTSKSVNISPGQIQWSESKRTKPKKMLSFSGSGILNDRPTAQAGFQQQFKGYPTVPNFKTTSEALGTNMQLSSYLKVTPTRNAKPSPHTFTAESSINQNSKHSKDYPMNNARSQPDKKYNNNQNSHMANINENYQTRGTNALNTKQTDLLNHNNQPNQFDIYNQHHQYLQGNHSEKQPTRSSQQMNVDNNTQPIDVDSKFRLPGIMVKPLQIKTTKHTNSPSPLYTLQGVDQRSNHHQPTNININLPNNKIAGIDKFPGMKSLFIASANTGLNSNSKVPIQYNSNGPFTAGKTTNLPVMMQTSGHFRDMHTTRQTNQVVIPQSGNLRTANQHVNHRFGGNAHTNLPSSAKIPVKPETHSFEYPISKSSGLKIFSTNTGPAVNNIQNGINRGTMNSRLPSRTEMKPKHPINRKEIIHFGKRTLTKMSTSVKPSSGKGFVHFSDTNHNIQKLFKAQRRVPRHLSKVLASGLHLGQYQHEGVSKSGGTRQMPVQSLYEKPILKVPPKNFKNSLKKKTINIIGSLTNNVKPSKTKLQVICSVSKLFAKIQGMYEWCNTKCNSNLYNCPRHICKCYKGVL